MESAASDSKCIGDASAHRNKQKQHRAFHDSSAHALSVGLAIHARRGVAVDVPLVVRLAGAVWMSAAVLAARKSG